MHKFQWRIAIAWVVLALAGSPGAHAKDPDLASQTALLKTQQMLRNPQARNKAISRDPQAQWVDKQVKSLGGSQANTNAIYDLSADLMNNLYQQTHGDPAKMKEILNQAKNDPQGFAARFTPDERAKLRAIANQISRTPASQAGTSAAQIRK